MDRRQNTVLEVKTAAWTDYIAGPIVCPKLEDAVGPRHSVDLLWLSP